MEAVSNNAALQLDKKSVGPFIYNILRSKFTLTPNISGLSYNISTRTFRNYRYYIRTIHEV
jgi:hypothetical protein